MQYDRKSGNFRSQNIFLVGEGYENKIRENFCTIVWPWAMDRSILNYFSDKDGLLKPNGAHSFLLQLQLLQTKKS